jgi:hypothetical protein
VKSIFFFLIFFTCLTSVFAQAKVLSVNKINKLVPGKIPGFLLKESKSNELKFGTIKYAICERIFVNRKRVVKILLFDYVEAQVMYTQAMQKWGQMQTTSSDSAVFRTINSSSFNGWESYTAKNNHSQLVLGIHQRFFLTLSGEQMELSELKNVLNKFDFSMFPD